MAYKDERIRELAILGAIDNGFPNARETWDDPNAPPGETEKAKFIATATKQFEVFHPYCPPLPPPQ